MRCAWCTGSDDKKSWRHWKLQGCSSWLGCFWCMPALIPAVLLWPRMFWNEEKLLIASCSQDWGCVREELFPSVKSASSMSESGGRRIEDAERHCSFRERKAECKVKAEIREIEKVQKGSSHWWGQQSCTGNSSSETLGHAWRDFVSLLDHTWEHR